MNISRNHFIFLLSLVILGACGGKKNSDNKSADNTEDGMGFQLVTSEESGIDFVNLLGQTEDKNIFDDIYFFNGSGVAVGDVNNDNLPDIFFGANQGTCKLYLNRGNFKFEDVTEKAGLTTTGWTTGVAMADIDNDGWLDIYVSRSSPYVTDDNRKNLLFLNNKTGTFTEGAAGYGIDNSGFSTQASFFDADNDGDLDMYLANRPIMYNGIYKENYKKYRFVDELGTHRMFINNKGKFQDISEKSGVLCNGYGLSANLADINQDGKTDIYVCNDFIYPDFMYFNKGDGTFTDVANERLKHTSLSSMGSDMADFNNDGLIDIFTVDMLPESNHRKKTNMNEDDYDKYYHVYRNGYGHQLMRNNLQLNIANKKFVDIGFMAGVAETDWSWAPLFADFNNDGLKDLFISNGYYKDYNDLDFMKFRNENQLSNNNDQGAILKTIAAMPETKLQNYIYMNNGNLTFTNKSDAWGLKEKTFTQGAAYADFDNDGDLDIVLNNLGAHPTIYKNNSTKNNYLKIRFSGKESNKFGIGCKVWATIKGETQYYELYTTRGFQSSVEPMVHVGLGKADKIDELIIWWPSGKAQKIMNAKVNTTMVANEADANISNYTLPKVEEQGQKLVQETTIPGLNFTHKESDYSDFRDEPLIPHMISRFGPSLAVADVNGDGLDDVFVGGGARVLTSALFIQTASGSFTQSITQPWAKDKNNEHVDAQFFDKDGDGDLDLILVSGGNEFGQLGDFYRPAIYENDGKGNFTLAVDALPLIQSPGLSVTTGDIDGDGDLDIFIGGSAIPRAYPTPTASFLLVNDGKGRYTDETLKWSDDLRTIGIVNEAVFADMNRDGKMDLVLAGYWMNVSVFLNMGNRFVNQTAVAGLSRTEGWWNALKVVDVDGDGDMDIIAGNEGLNNLMRVTPSTPAYLVRGDMNRNNSLDAVCFYTLGGVQVPLHSYDEIRQQLPDLIQKRFPKVAMYATATKDNIFTKEELVNSTQYNLNMFASGVFINNKGKFDFKPFPMYAQMSNINDIKVTYLNNDQLPDLILVGNSDATRISLGRNDASNGLVLVNKGGVVWETFDFTKTGFFASKNAQRVDIIRTKNGNYWIVANNSDNLQLFKPVQAMQ